MATTALPFDPIDEIDRYRRDRLGFTVLLALALHAAVILGISFDKELREQAAAKLEITLAQYRSEKTPDRVDFLAQNNQEGSGTLKEKALLTTRHTADFHDNAIREVSQQQQVAAQQQQARQQTLVSTTANTPAKSAARAERDETQQQSDSEVTLLQRSMEIASLEAKLDIQRQAYAARPRVRRLTSVATRRSEDALYLNEWRNRIEQVGNRHYPQQARDRGIFGDLRLMVALLPNGEVHEVKVLKSSGQKMLDEAAIRIVHLAAPYQPFPSEMRRQVDVLEIIRTWRFHKGQLRSES